MHCETCKERISIEANTCPHCGHYYPRWKRSKTFIYLTDFLFLIIWGWAVSILLSHPSLTRTEWAWSDYAINFCAYMFCFLATRRLAVLIRLIPENGPGSSDMWRFHVYQHKFLTVGLSAGILQVFLLHKGYLPPNW